jgi:hypothetical protein
MIILITNNVKIRLCNRFDGEILINNVVVYNTMKIVRNFGLFSILDDLVLQNCECCNFKGFFYKYYL